MFSPLERLLRAPKTGRRGKKEPAASGNETVFRGSVQPLRAVFPGRGERPGPRIESGLLRVESENRFCESNRPDRVEWFRQ